MSEFGEREVFPVTRVVAAFSARVLERARQLEELNTFFCEALPFVSDVAAVNERLVESGRADLAIQHSAPMMEVTQPEETVSLKCNNFAPKFEFSTGVRAEGEPGPDLIPPTKEEVEALRDLPILRSYKDFRDMVASGQFPPLTLIPSHAGKPAFTRMLLLFPDFTVSLVLGMSDGSNEKRYDMFENRLYVAYQLMARLVDASDPYVLQEDGSIDSWHLCR